MATAVFDPLTGFSTLATMQLVRTSLLEIASMLTAQSLRHGSVGKCLVVAFAFPLSTTLPECWFAINIGDVLADF